MKCCILPRVPFDIDLFHLILICDVVFVKVYKNITLVVNLTFQRIQEEILNREKKFAYLDEAALYLIQKGDSADAISVQAELDTFRQYHRQVMDRMAVTKAKLEVQQVILGQ